jgi:hypothetical protein
MNKTFGLIGLAFIALASLGYAFQQKSQIDEVTAVCEKEKQESKEKIGSILQPLSSTNRHASSKDKAKIW